MMHMTINVYTVSSKVYIVSFDPFFKEDSKSNVYYHVHCWNNMTQLTFPFSILSSDASKFSDVSTDNHV